MQRFKYWKWARIFFYSVHQLKSDCCQNELKKANVSVDPRNQNLDVIILKLHHIFTLCLHDSWLQIDLFKMLLRSLVIIFTCYYLHNVFFTFDILKSPYWVKYLSSPLLNLKQNYYHSFLGILFSGFDNDPVLNLCLSSGSFYLLMPNRIIN